MVVVAGPRQAGKSTLAARVVAEARGTWLSLDDTAVLDVARTDPVGFVRGRRGSVGIDEAQRVPDLLLAIKAEVDAERRPGRFLLTGSTRLLGAPQLADSLAGRMEALTLWPFTQAELVGGAGKAMLIDAAFGDSVSNLNPPAIARSEVLERAGAGGFLPALDRTGRRRTAWFDSYVAGVIDREVRVVTDATYLRELPRLLRLCAARTAGELNVADLARDLGLSRPTTDSYLAHLEAVFLIQTIPAWSTNLTARVVRRPKLTLTDTGLAARLLGGRLRSDPELAGRLVETFGVDELRAQAEWSQTRPSIFHFRDRDGAEVDLVLESGDGRVVGIEVKAGATIRAEDIGGLRLLERRLGRDFAAGLVLCAAPEPRHLGGRLWILPISGSGAPACLTPESADGSTPGGGASRPREDVRSSSSRTRCPISFRDLVRVTAGRPADASSSNSRVRSGTEIERSRVSTKVDSSSVRRVSGRPATSSARPVRGE